MSRYRVVLAIGRYRWLWLGDTVSSLGDTIGFLALVWLVYATTDSASSIGWFVAVYTAPVVLGGPIVGVALDRFDRRRLLIADNVVRSALMALVPLLHYGHALQTWYLYVVAFAYGALRMFPLAGVPSLIPDLVPDDLLETANALETVSFFLSGVVGAALAGVLVAAIGSANTLWLDAGSYAFFALALWRMGSPGRTSSVAATGSGSIREAFRFVFATPVIAATTVMFMLVNVGEGILQVINPVYVKEVLSSGATTYGAVVSVSAAAGVSAALVAGASPRSLPLGRAIGISEVLAGLVYCGLAGRPALAIAFVLFALGAFLLGPLTVWAQTIRMRFIAPEMRGRAFGLLRTLMQATVPIGALVAGPLLAGGRISTAIVIAAGVIVVPGVAGLASGMLLHDRPQSAS